MIAAILFVALAATSDENGAGADHWKV